MTDAWKYYERGRAYNNSLVPNQYTMVNTNNFSCHTKSMHYFSANYVLSTTHPSPTQLSQSPAYQYDSYSVGNPLLQPYVTHKADVGWNKYFESGSSVSIEAYGVWNQQA